MKCYEDLIAAIEEMINTGTSVMAPYPVDVVGRPSPFGKKNVKKSKGAGGEKRAPHTEIYEEYEKQSMGNSKPAMYKYSYKKAGNLRKVMEDIASVCEAIIEEGRQEGESQADFTKRMADKKLAEVKANIANLKAERRNAKKEHEKAYQQLKEVEKNKEDIGYPIRSMMIGQKIKQNKHKKWEAEDKVKELASLRDRLKK
jgi:hypothetical protein